jgi:hypothetical protein
MSRIISLEMPPVVATQEIASLEQQVVSCFFISR